MTKERTSNFFTI